MPPSEEIENSEDYIPVPSSFDIHEWSIMERFAKRQSDPDIADRLLGAIHGGGAFRRFKDATYELGIEQQWYRFREEAFVKIAIRFLEDHDLPYTHDLIERKED